MPHPDAGMPLALPVALDGAALPGMADEAAALQRLHAMDPALVLVFGSPRHALGPMAARLSAGLPGVTIAGCSSAGELGHDGYRRGTVQLIGFPRATFRAAAIALPRQGEVPVTRWLALLRDLAARFPARPGWQRFGLLLADGTARNEEVLAATLDAALPGVPLVGGSAGDALAFHETCQIIGTEVLTGAAVFVLAETSLGVADVTFAHFSPTAQRAVVTRADPQSRIIFELNAEPAAEEYARLAGLDPGGMQPADFAAHPLLVRAGGRHHVRAISEVTADGALRLLSAVDTGTVLTLGRAQEVTDGFAAIFDRLPRPPMMVLGFECILRRLAVERAGMAGAMADLFARYGIAGFNTYGEQHGGMHVNQTFVGLALMPAAGAP